MKFRTTQTGMTLSSKWNSINSNLKNTTAIIGGKAVVLPVILRVEDIDEIINDSSIVDEAKIYIRNTFNNKINRNRDIFYKKYIPDQDVCVINPYICIWSTDLNAINHLAMIEISSISKLNEFINGY